MSDYSENNDNNTQAFVSLTKGTEIGRYRIIEKIGAGGMGEVYLAEDTELNRKVALKFLPYHFCQDEDCRIRFKREAQAVAGLDHGNIVTVYEVGEYMGRPFIAMQYIEAQSLSEIIKDKESGIDDVIGLAIQLCEGLREAHENGIVHRDVKPSNILISKRGRARLVDFGLAAVKGEDKLTKTGSTLGTAGYMSPEQIKGETVDHRSDLFSLGVVLYEMIAGRKPFEAEHEAAIQYNILHEQPEPLARYKKDMPEQLQQVIDRALDKDRETRYQSAAGMLADLKRLKKELESARVAWHAGPTRTSIKKVLIPSLVLVVALAILLLKPWKLEIGPGQEATAIGNRLAIMNFVNVADNSDTGKFGEISADLLMTDLAESKYISVVSSQRLYDILRQLGHESQKGISRDVATGVAGKARARYLLTGSILQTEPNMVITSRLVDITTGDVIASQKVSGETGETIFAVVDKLSAAVKSDLSLPESAMAEPEIPVIDLTTNSLEAYKHYLEGQRLFYKGLYPESKLALRKAIALDSTFAMAYLPLATILAVDRDPEALLLISEANRLADKTTTRERLFIRALYAYFHKNYDESYNHLYELVEKYPDDKHAIYWLGWMTLHDRRQPEKAIEYFSKVLELDSLFMNAYDQMAKAHFDLNNYEKSLWYLDKYIDMNPDDVYPYFTRGKIHYYNRDFEKAIQDFEKSIQLKSDFYNSYVYLAPLYLKKDDFEKARFSYQILASDHENRARRSDARTGLALVSMFQGKLHEALTILNEGIRQDSLENAFHGAEGDMAHKYFFKAKIYLEKEYLDSALYFAEQCMNACSMVKTENELCFAQYYVEFLARAGEYSLAEQQADEMKRKLTDAGEPLGVYWYTMACIEQSRNNFKEAENYIDKALETGRYFDYEYKKALICLAAEQAEMAIELFVDIQLNRIDEYWPLLMSRLDYYLGVAYELNGRNSKAIEQYVTFLNRWKNADPGIFEVDDAKKRVARLKSKT